MTRTFSPLFFRRSTSAMLSALPVLVLASGCLSGRDEGGSRPSGRRARRPELSACGGGSQHLLSGSRREAALARYGAIPKAAQRGVGRAGADAYPGLDQTYRGLRIFEGEAIARLGR